MKPFIHKIQYYETDRMKVTHHSNYIRFMEEARVDFMEQTGLSYQQMEADGIVSPVISVSCEYKHPPFLRRNFFAVRLFDAPQ